MTAKKKPIASPAPLIDDDGEVRELTAEDFALFRPAADFPELVEVLRRQGRPALPPEERKRRVTLHLDPDVLERLKADGKGWQTRANAALRRALGL
jgi:uncharacterized protein (DUF4415 family)